MIYQKEFEQMPREEIKKLQSEKLVKQIKRVYENVECFRNRMDEKGIKPEDIKGIEDLYKVPFSYKNDLRDNYPYGLFAVPMENIVELHASSGTTGKQIVVGYTEKDIEDWSSCMARLFSAVGANESSFIQNAFGYGLFTGGFGAHYGAKKIGATVIPISSGNTSRQIQTMIDFKTTVLCCTPSYALHLAETVEEMGVLDKLSLKAGIFGAEPWTEEMRKEIEQRLNIKAYDVYGLTEVMGPGVAYECEYQSGMHINEDKFIVEIIDPETGNVLPEGSTGELVFTTLDKEGFPIIRYRTKDICTLDYCPCKCGRTFIKMCKPKGRSDDMMIIKGVNVFPSQIEEVLINYGEGITPNYQIIVGRENNSDTLDINVEMNEELFDDDVKSISKVEKDIIGKLRSVLGIGAKVHLVNPKSIARSEGKAKRIIDNRNLY